MATCPVPPSRAHTGAPRTASNCRTAIARLTARTVIPAGGKAHDREPSGCLGARLRRTAGCGRAAGAAPPGAPGKAGGPRPAVQGAGGRGAVCGQAQAVRARTGWRCAGLSAGVRAVCLSVPRRLSEFMPGGRLGLPAAVPLAAASHGCRPLDDQAPALVRGGQVVPFFVTPSFVGVATTTTNGCGTAAPRLGLDRVCLESIRTNRPGTAGLPGSGIASRGAGLHHVERGCITWSGIASRGSGTALRGSGTASSGRITWNGAALPRNGGCTTWNGGSATRPMGRSQELPAVNRIFRPPLAIGASIACAAASLVWLAPGAQAIPEAGASSALRYAASVGAGAPAVTGQPTPAGASDIADLGAHGWGVASSATATQSGAQISAPSFDASSWLRVRNDNARAPGTEIEALLQNGRCPVDPALQPVNESSSGSRSVFFSDNMRKCYGYEKQVGADTAPQFRVPWWWRTEFTPRLRAGQHATLIVNGVIGSANVWVNGHEVATSGTV